MKLVSIIGARPQFIKAATVSRAIAARADMVEKLVHTGQHFDDNMSDVFFRELEIEPPAYNLEISGGPHGQMTGRQLEAVETVLTAEKPDRVIVYGDTNSTVAGAIAAAKMNIPIAHVEAGLRSFNRRMPEEINRVVTDHVSDLLFAPTETAMHNLAGEGLAKISYLVGDVMYDAALAAGAAVEGRSSIMSGLGVQVGGFRLATVHRAENTDDIDRLTVIFAALRTLAKEKPLVLPLHPRTAKVLDATGDAAAMTNGITITEPLGFFDMAALMRAASLVLTDSGGVQKESFFHGTPAVVLRHETEWVELLDIGWTVLAPPVSEDSVLSMAHSLEMRDDRTPAAPYGDGHAAELIVDLIEQNTK